MNFAANGRVKSCAPNVKPWEVSPDGYKTFRLSLAVVRHLQIKVLLWSVSFKVLLFTNRKPPSSVSEPVDLSATPGLPAKRKDNIALSSALLKELNQALNCKADLHTAQCKSQGRCSVLVHCGWRKARQDGGSVSRNSLPWRRQWVHLGPLTSWAALRHPMQVGRLISHYFLYNNCM